MDHQGEERTAVCCLASLNVETWDQWCDEPGFIEDVMRMLDNVLSNFIATAPDSMARAKYSAMRERSVGLGVMGFHSFLQARGIPMESVLAKSWNLRIFKKIRREADLASYILAEARVPVPMPPSRAKERFSHKIAIAPTPISIICGGTSACIERYRPTSTRTRRCPAPSWCAIRTSRKCLPPAAPTPEVWQSIVELEGSVQHLEFLSGDEKAVFRTAFEIDQRWIVDLAADRAPFVCQSQSLNLFLPADIDKWDLHMLHWTAWQRGIKSLYYCRSRSVSRAAVAGRLDGGEPSLHAAAPTDYEECLACQ